MMIPATIEELATLVNRDDYMEVAKKWNIYGIPSLVVLENGQEIGRFVNRERKTKMQINEFLAQLV